MDGYVSKLRSYAGAGPRMRNGVAALTNGAEWWVYDLAQGGAFTNKLVDRVNILAGRRRSHAEFLNEWLGRSGFG